MTRRTIPALCLALLASAASAADPVKDRIAARIAEIFGDTRITSIAPSPIPGVYEITLGPSLIYMSADARYVMRGDLLDLEQRSNLTDIKRAKARRDAFASMDTGKFIEFPAAGKPKQTLYVYTDIDCGYCRRLHQEVPELNAAGIGVRYLAFPRSGLDGDSFQKAAAVWCSADRQKAMTAAKTGKDVSAKTCKHPVAEQYNLGQAMGVSGTPAVYTEDGEQIGGYVPAKELIEMVRDGRI